MTEPGSSTTPEPNAALPTAPRRRIRLIFWIVAVVLVVLVGMFTAGLAAAWRKMVQEGCRNNLKQVGMELRQYAAEHDGRFPAKWVELNWTGEKTNWARLLHCPFTKHEIGPWERVDLWSDYRLIPGRTTNDPPDTLLVIEPLANNKSEGANVLYVNGMVEWLSARRVLGLPELSGSGTMPVTTTNHSAR